MRQPADALIGNPFRYTGRRVDPKTDLYYYRARYFSPKLGRFLQTDPIGSKDDITLYQYAHHDPQNKTDPTGEAVPAVVVACFASPSCVAIVGTIAYVAGQALAESGEAISDAASAVGEEISEVHQDVVTTVVDAAEEIKNTVEASEHDKGARPSTEEKHEKGQARKGRDRGGEKADEGRRPPRKRPPEHKGPWPPKPASSASEGSSQESQSAEQPKLCSPDSDGKPKC